MSSKFAFYVRVSTSDKQDFKRQIEDLHAWVGTEYKLHEDIDVYQESISGFNDDREELNRLMDKVESDSNYYDCIYITEISRLGRSPRKVREVLNKLEDHKVNLRIQKPNQISLLNEEGERFGMGSLILDIMMHLAEEEVAYLKARSKSGILSSMKAGKINGGKFKAYGFYAAEDKTMMINYEEAEVVKTIFNLYKNGHGTRWIANYLNENEIKTRSQKSFENEIVNSTLQKLGRDVVWSDKTVDGILQNPIYKGKRRYYGGTSKLKKKQQTIELLDIHTDCIIEPDLWDKCMEIRKSKTHRNYLTDYIYLLKDKITCGCCGRNYFAKYKPTPQGDKVYICSSRLKKGGNCGNVGVNISLIESAIFNEIVDSESLLKFINTKDKIRINIEKTIQQLKTDIAAAESQIARLGREVESTGDLLISSNAKKQTMLVELFQRRLDEKVNELKNAEKRLRKNKSKLKTYTEALKKSSNIETTSEMLKDSVNDRIKLEEVYNQFIDNVIINAVDKDRVLANVHLSIDGVPLPKTLKLILDIAGIRKRTKVFRYMPLADMTYEPQYDDNGVLQTKLETIRYEIDMLLGGSKNLGEDEDLAGLTEHEFINIRNQHILTIPIVTKTSEKTSRLN